MPRNTQKIIDLKEEIKIAETNMKKFERVHRQIAMIIMHNPGVFNVEVLKTLCATAELDMETFNFINNIRNQELLG